MTLASKLGDMKPLEAWNDTQAFLLNDLSKSFGELLITQRFDMLCQRIYSGDLSKVNDDTKNSFKNMFLIHTLTFIEQDMGTFRHNDYISSDLGEDIRDEIIEQCSIMKKYAMNLADLLYPGEELLDSAIARESGDLYNEFMQKVY
jgi:hypothetical protein